MSLLKAYCDPPTLPLHTFSSFCMQQMFGSNVLYPECDLLTEASCALTCGHKKKEFGEIHIQPIVKD